MLYIYVLKENSLFSLKEKERAGDFNILNGIFHWINYNCSLISLNATYKYTGLINTFLFCNAAVMKSPQFHNIYFTCSSIQHRHRLIRSLNPIGIWCKWSKQVFSHVFDVHQIVLPICMSQIIYLSRGKPAAGWLFVFFLLMLFFVACWWHFRSKKKTQ